MNGARLRVISAHHQDEVFEIPAQLFTSRLLTLEMDQDRGSLL